jgi:hypothetical protein
MLVTGIRAGLSAGAEAGPSAGFRIGELPARYGAEAWPARKIPFLFLCARVNYAFSTAHMSARSSYQKSRTISVRKPPRSRVAIVVSVADILHYTVLVA